MEEILTATISGLTSEEVSARIAEKKVNGDVNVKTKSVAQILRTNIFTFFNILFAVIGVIMAFFITHDFEGLANYGYLLVAIVNCLIGIVQELMAKRTIDKLSLLSAPKVIAIRDGAETEIMLKDIVLDDVIKLTAGDQICADSVVIEGKLEVNEALITGESDPVAKSEGEELKSGSFVISGTAYVRVIHIGKDNYAAKITESAKKLKAQNSEIYRSLMKVIKFMSIIIVPIGIALFCVKYFAHGADELNATVLTVLGTLIGMIPSGLVALTSAVFCVSVLRLARHHALAQDLYCTEALARVDVLCLDKTGTITEGCMEVTGIVPKAADADETMRMMKKLTANVGDNNPTSQAIADYAKDAECDERAEEVIPFSSARKWSGANFNDGALVMGAAEFVFGKLKKSLAKEIEDYSALGLRVLVIAKSDQPIENEKLPKGLTLEAIVLIADKIRESAPSTLKYFDEQGVAIKIISGDNPVTVMSVAKRAGVKNAEQYIDATTLVTENDIYEAAEKYTVFGRVTPDQKLQLVKALKARKHVVGMTGDGINDVMALRESDCSIAVASGSDASKNVSKLVLLDSDFASLPKVVAEGRRCINNLQRSASLFLIKTIYSTLFALVFMILSADLPFLPKNLTLIGYITIGPPAFVLALEPNKEIVKGKFLSTVLRNSMPVAFTIVISVVIIFLVSPLMNISPEQLSTVSVIVTVAVGYIFLIKLCLPFTWIRITLLVLLLALFVVSFFLPVTRAFFGLCDTYNADMFILALPTIAGSVIIFVGMQHLFKHVRLPERFRNKIENAIEK